MRYFPEPETILPVNGEITRHEGRGEADSGLGMPLIPSPEY